jgi:putative PEP-CTERM system histidine kinase
LSDTSVAGVALPVMAPALHEARTSRERREHDDHAVWSEFTRRLSLPLGIDEIAAELVEYAMRVTRAPSGAAYLLSAGDTGAETYRLAAHAGPTRFTGAIEREAALPSRLRQTSSPVHLPAALRSSVTTTAPPLAALATPIRWRTTLLGFLVLAFSDAVGERGVGRLRVLGTLADQAAASIEAVRLSGAATHKAVDRLATTAIHDIKNSVSALSLLVRNAATNLSDPQFQRDAVTTLSRTVDRLSRLLATLSAPLPEAPAAGEPIDLEKLIIEATAALATDHRVHLIRRLSPIQPVYGDRDALLRVVENLTTNAAEAIPDEGTVTVTLSEDHGQAVISVADTGCGIPQDFRERRLFAPFQTTKKGGWGVGLYQAKQAVEQQDGEILVESVVGRGTTFTVKLPLRAQADQSFPESVR